jgi:hypothetical protein
MDRDDFVTLVTPGPGGVFRAEPRSSDRKSGEEYEFRSVQWQTASWLSRLSMSACYHDSGRKTSMLLSVLESFNVSQHTDRNWARGGTLRNQLRLAAMAAVRSASLVE